MHKTSPDQERSQKPPLKAQAGSARLPQPQTGSLVNSQLGPDHAPVSPQAALQLQRLLGNRRTSQLLSQQSRPQPAPTQGVQANISVGPAGDNAEQEADRVADQVTGNAPAISRAHPGRRETTGPQIASRTDETRLSPDFENRLRATRGGGAHLPEGTRRGMEARLGADFEKVRLHTGQEAVRLNREVGAQAFTHGSDIYLGESHGAIESAEGQRLLAHELTHTIQQGAAPVRRRPLDEPAGGRLPAAARPQPNVSPSSASTIQRKITSGWGTNKAKVFNNIKAKLGGNPFTESQLNLLNQIWADPNSSYSIDQVVQVLKAKAVQGNVHGPVTIVSQKTEPPKPAESVKIDFSQKGKSSVSKGEKAHASFEALVELVNPPPNTKIGYLQTVRFSRRAIKEGEKLGPAFGMANVRDGAEDDAPWMVKPQLATGPVLIKMQDEPGQYGPVDHPEVSAEGADVFTTWLVSTTEDTPYQDADVQFLYHWNWKVDWTGKKCAITSAGPGQGANSPVLEGVGARRLYNNFLRSGMVVADKPHYQFQEAVNQLKEGLKGPNLDTQVDSKLLSEVLAEMRQAWHQMDELKQKKYRPIALGVLDEYMMRVQRRRPAQQYLGEELGFKNL